MQFSVCNSFSVGGVHSHEYCACVVTKCRVNLYIMLSVMGSSSTAGHSIVYNVSFFYSNKISILNKN